MNDKELIERYGRPYIDQDFLDKVENAVDNNNERLHQEKWKIWDREKLDPDTQRHLCDLCREFENFSQEDLAVATIVAVKNFPEMVFQIMMEEYLSVINKENKKYGNS